MELKQKMRLDVDTDLAGAGWGVQDRKGIDIFANKGVAGCDFELTSEYGCTDYLFFNDSEAVGMFEARSACCTLFGVGFQAQEYAMRQPIGFNLPVELLPLLNVSAGAITRFINLLDADLKGRNVFRIARAEWLSANTLNKWVKWLHPEGVGLCTAAEAKGSSALRSRIRTLVLIGLDDLWTKGLYLGQAPLVNNIEIEELLRKDCSKVLVQMATCRGKTIFANNAIRHIIERGNTCCDLFLVFLVDCKNLSEWAERAFEGYQAPKKLGRAYEVLGRSRGWGALSKRLLTNVLAHFAAHEEELVPYAEQIAGGGESWMAQQAHNGWSFSSEQGYRFEAMRDRATMSLEVDIDHASFAEEGGVSEPHQVFRRGRSAFLNELNEAWAA